MHLYTQIVVLISIGSVEKCSTLLEGISQDNEAHIAANRLNIPISRQHTEPWTAGTEYEGGNTIITGDGGLFFSPNKTVESRWNSTKRFRQSRDSEPRIYIAKMRPTEDIVQIQVTLDMLMSPPTKGGCIDKLEIVGANPGIRIPVLCGNITWETLFFDIDKSDGPYEIRVTIMESSQEQMQEQIEYLGSDYYYWRMGIVFHNKTVAPRGCLQYHEEAEGFITTFNFYAKTPMALNNQMYNICFENRPNCTEMYFNCGVDFELGKSDDNDNCGNEYLLIKDKEHCGNPERLVTIAPNDSPVMNVTVRTNGDNTAEDKGFKIKFRWQACN